MSSVGGVLGYGLARDMGPAGEGSAARVPDEHPVGGIVRGEEDTHPGAGQQHRDVRGLQRLSGARRHLSSGSME